MLFTDELEKFIENLKAEKVFIYSGLDTDSKLHTIDPEQKYLQHVPSVDKNSLWTTINNLRVIKTEE